MEQKSSGSHVSVVSCLSANIGSCKQFCKRQRLSEQRQRCRRMDCFQQTAPNRSRGSRESSTTNGGWNNPRNDECSGRQRAELLMRTDFRDS